jgi:hypothetical protein
MISIAVFEEGEVMGVVGMDLLMLVIDMHNKAVLLCADEPALPADEPFWI